MVYDVKVRSKMHCENLASFEIYFDKKATQISYFKTRVGSLMME